MTRLCAALFCLLAAATGGTALANDGSCRVIDLLPDYWRAVDSTKDRSPEEEVLEFRRLLVTGHEDLYGKGGLRFASESQLNDAIVRSMDASRHREDELKTATDRFERRFPAYLRQFQAQFRDFRCDFPIYLVHSLGRMDGGGRVIDGKPSLVFGVDVIASEDAEKIGILIDHELFHRYHFQVAGFSDDKGSEEVLWRALWAEGLATYVSMKLNPPASMQDALVVPQDLVARSAPLLPELISELQPHLDEVNAELYAKFFSYQGADANPPSRVGYYIGALVAERLARHHSLPALAHMPAAEVRKALAAQLVEISRGTKRVV
jgi:hypothetical protein